MIIKTSLKHIARALYFILGFLLFYSGFLVIYMRFKYRRKLLIVFYHEVGENQGALGSIVTKIKHFERQIRFLSRWFQPVDINNVNSILSNQIRIQQPVLITFDGGYKGNRKYALPILEKYLAPGLIYIVTRSIDQEYLPWTVRLSYILRSTKKKVLEWKLNDKPLFRGNLDNYKISGKVIKQTLSSFDSQTRDQLIEELAIKLDVSLEELTNLSMSWEDISFINKSELITIGSHTITHPRLSEISEEEAKKEILSSKEIIEDNIGENVVSFCYPDGKINTTISRLVEEAGYQNATTTKNGANNLNSDPFLLKRIGGGNMPVFVFALKVSGIGRKLYV